MLKRKDRTILLVEDEPIIAMTEKRQLEQYGYVVVTVPTGEEAVQAVETCSGIDLILMDINLGDGIDGTEAAGIILKDHDIPIVFLSSHTEPAIVEKTEKITSYGYVVKNSSITVLDASIKMAFKLSEARNKAIEKEKALIRSEEKYRLISENTSDGIVHFSPDGLIDYASPSYLRQLGYPELQELGKKHDAILPEIHRDDQETLFSSIYDAIGKKQDESTYTYRVRHADGHYIWREDHASFRYDSSGAYLGAYVSCRDVTDRKNIENRLMVLAKAIEASPVMIVITDTRGIIEYVNPRFSCITGYSSKEALGKNPRILKSGKTDDTVYSDLWKTLTSGNEWKGYFRNRKKSGEFYYESATIAPVKNQKGETTNYIAIKEDLTEKKYMQESLDESEEKYRLLHELAGLGIGYYSPDGTVLSYNKLAAAYMGGIPEEFIGKSIHDIFSGPDADVYLDRLRKAAGSAAPDVYEDMVPLPIGNKYFLSTFTRITDSDGNVLGVQIISQDITDQKRTEQALQMKNEEYEAVNEELRSTTEELQVKNEELIQSQECLVQNEKRLIQAERAAKIGNWALLLSSNTIIASHGAEEIYGVDFGRLPLAAVQQIPLPEYRPALDKALHDLVTSNTAYDLEFRIRRPSDGTIIDIHSIATYDRKSNTVFGVIQDITDRKRTEHALKESQERLRFALEGSNLGEWDWHLHTNKIQRNERWAGMLGYTADEIIDDLQQGFDLQHPDDREATWKAVQDHLDGGTDHYSIEYRMKTKSGRYKWIHDCGKIMERDAQGKPLRLCGTHADIDEQKVTGDKIKALLAEKELLLQEVHHRIKNNMSTISSLLSLQADSVKDVSAVIALQDAGNRIQSMSVLYDKLYRSLEYTDLSIKEYLSSLVDDIIAYFPNSQLVSIKKDLQDFTLDVKRLQALGIIINELLTNIMKHAFSGKDSGHIAVSAHSSDGHITISVQDNGIGLPGSGTFRNSKGFGLQLVLMLSEQLKGTVSMEKQNGTRFVLEFEH
jgi:PAS domain S-box-containing protein